MNGHQKQREESRKMIETGLFELMREKDFDKITVSEIAERSDVARRTFYRLYKSKEDVICQHFGKLCQDYKNRYPALEGYNIRQISKEYFCFWHQHREFLLLLHKCGLDRMLYYEMSRVSSAVIKARIGCETLKRETGLEYFADYSTVLQLI